MDTETQLYVVTGVLSAAILILFALVIFALVQLKSKKAQRIKNEERFLTMADPSIHRGEELERRGYGMYNGPDQGHMHGHAHPHPPHAHDQHMDHHKKKKSSSHPKGPKGAPQYPQHHGSIPSVNTSIYQGYQGRVTDPIPAIFPQSTHIPPNQMQRQPSRSAPHNYR